jgi:thioredoxin reductase
MTGLLTALAFAGLTAILVAWHVRRTSRASDCACPRCKKDLPHGARRCPHCDVPLQVYELAAAPVDLAESATPAVDEGAAHAIVRADVCVGCGLCVPACPEPGAIRLDGKLAVVDREKCKGHGRCVEACPVGGILLATGAAVHRIVVPDVRTDFQSNVPGLYVVGELGGRGLIKNAINEGRIAAENVARELAYRPNPGTSPDLLDVAIVGSGPAGLSAALAAKSAGLRCAVLEQGTLADTIRKYPRHKLLLAEPVRVPLFGELWVADASKETLLSVWQAVAEEHELEIRSGHRVHSVEKVGAVFRVRGEGFEVRARRVILAMGRRGTPRRLGVPGEEAENVFYDVLEMEEFAGRKVLVVGGGDSALESALGLANQPGTQVALSHRRSTFERAKERNLRKIDEAERAGRVRILRESVVKSIEPACVVLDVAGERMALPNDDVIVRIGGEPPSGFLERSGIRIVSKSIPIEEAQASVSG